MADPAIDLHIKGYVDSDGDAQPDVQVDFKVFGMTVLSHKANVPLYLLFNTLASILAPLKGMMGLK